MAKTKFKYVDLPKMHPWFGKSYNDIVLDIDVHGGLTYSRNHRPNSKNDKSWWIGFDCAHWNDFCPSVDPFWSECGIYRDIEYVKAECISLATQIVQYGT